MRWLPVFRREFGAAVTSPAHLLFAALFFALLGILFSDTLALFADASAGSQAALTRIQEQAGSTVLNVNDYLARNFFGIVLGLLIFAVPFFTMRLIAEERKLGTYDLLLSYPLRELDLLLGKFFAAWAAVCLMLGLSVLYPLLMAWLSGGQIEVAPLAAGYLGLVCASAGFVAIGLLASSLTENQLVAGLLTLGLLLLGLLLGNLAPGESGWLSSTMQSLDLYERTEAFLSGVIRLADVMHFAFLTAAAIFLADKALIVRRLGVMR